MGCVCVRPMLRRSNGECGQPAAGKILLITPRGFGFPFHGDCGVSNDLAFRGNFPPEAIVATALGSSINSSIKH